MPDSSIMLELCNELKISVNELLSGEMIEVKEYDNKTQELLVELARQDELKNKKLMISMFTILITSSIFYTAIIFLAINTLEKRIITWYNYLYFDNSVCNSLFYCT